MPKRNAWLQSSFDFDTDFKNNPTPKKRNSFEESLNFEFESFNYPTNHSLKKKSNSSLSFLLNACEPQKSADLAISRQKQKEITKWFVEKVKKGKPNVLLISGPAGCGKTAALKVIAKENKFEIIEWITPIDQIHNEYNYVIRQGERFEDFLIRATRYNSVLSNFSNRLLLVKDLPNSYVEGKDNFSDLLQKYFQYGREPLVFIMTETGNSRFLTTLFAPAVRDQFNIDLISINATTPTSLKNVLKRVSSILNAKASHMLHVTQNKIDEVLSNNIGDARSALLNLIFCSLKIPNENLTRECSSRGETLGLLHGIGRIIHPKRVIDGVSWKFSHNPDELASYFQSQANTVLSFIHENCLNTIGSNMTGAASTLDHVSLTDIMNSEWRDFRMHQVALSYCIRGVMISNDKPVSQWNPVRKPSRNLDNVKRNHCAAEINWYTHFINSKSKIKPDISGFEELSESLIEEIGEW